MYTSIQAAIYEARLLMNNSNPKDDQVIIKWAFDALSMLGPISFDVKVERIDIEGDYARKPCGYISTREVSVFTNEGFRLNAEYQKSARSLNDKKNGTFYITEDRNYFYLHNQEDFEPTYIEVEYYSYPVDEYGDVMVSKSQEEAIVRYILWRNAIRYSESIKQPYMARDYKSNWISAMMKAKADMKMPNVQEAEYINQQWISLIPNLSLSKRVN